MKAWKEFPYGLKVAIAFVLFFATTLFFGYFRGKDTAPLLSIEHMEPDPTLAESWSGKPKVIYFWTTWCSVCKVYAPILEANLKLLPADFVFLSVREAEENEVSPKVKLENGKQVYLADFNLLKDWQVNAYPTTVFLDKDNKVRFSDTGIISPIGFVLRTFLTKHF